MQPFVDVDFCLAVLIIRFRFLEAFPIVVYIQQIRLLSVADARVVIYFCLNVLHINLLVGYVVVFHDWVGSNSFFRLVFASLLFFFWFYFILVELLLLFGFVQFFKFFRGLPENENSDVSLCLGISILDHVCNFLNRLLLKESLNSNFMEVSERLS